MPIKQKLLAVSSLAIALGAITLFVATTYAVPLGAAATPALGQYHDHDRDHDRDRDNWDQPPTEFRDIQRQGFHDGIEGARKDFENHRRPDVNNRDEYRHPNVPREARHDYREGFRRGYQMAVSHMMMNDHRH